MEPGDKGIWATCTRGMEGKCTEELLSLFEKYAERFYSLSAEANGEEEKDGEENDIDIEASIQKEIISLKKSKISPARLFQPIPFDLPCVLFFKVNPQIDPFDFVDRICKSIENNDDEEMKSRYTNRLTPVSLLSKATEKGLDELCGHLLSQHFKVRNRLSDSLDQTEIKNEEFIEEKVKNIDDTSTYAIRPTVRNHSTLKRDQLIKQIASTISDTHKVNLTNPDKVIIVEVYRNICGMSVVDGKDWERLKRYNISELYLTQMQGLAQITVE
ncbi:tRNA acetyltransferase TAN1 [Erysiphe neolycopersici]|uniref:tRNA acetyltransferase TAN1 n=1 Tax=Erysiphe neolycopersici TaxID=212602 RepID=A0A420I1T1_9PEZI|nr:tRNA acetyltransferase TAN1 [Erysiphe neolycopersici]